MQKQLEARLVCYRQGNTRGDVLVEATDINVVLRLGEVSALTFKLPGLYSMGTDAGYVNYSRALIDNWDVALEVSWGKGWYEPFNARFEIVKEERDDDLYGKVALTGVGIISDLAYGFNLSTGKIGKKTGTHDYSMVGAAQIMSDWITSAQSQGSMPRLRWKRSGSGYVTDTAHGWTTAADSAGKAWAANSKVNASFQRTASALDVQRSLVGAVEWVTRGNTLCLYNTGTLEKPLKPGGVELILGRELENIPLAREISERVQRVVAFGEKGISRTAHNGSVGGTRGPRTRAVTVGGEKVLANLTARAEAEVTARQEVREELRRDMDLFHAEFLPWRDFELGARVVSEGWTTAREEYTVSELILRETGPEHGLQVAVTLGDPTKTAVERIQMAVRNLAGSAGDAPQGGAAGGVAGAGGSISDPRADEGPPAAPVISSLEVHHTISPSGFTTAGIQVAWSPVTLAASGEPLWRDVLEYRVEGRDGRSPSNPWVYWGSTSGDLGSPVLVKDGLFPGQSYWVRVSARTQEGWGDYSTAVEIFSGQDSTPPPKPKPPILSSAQGTVTAEVAGEFVNNVARPADLSHFEVWVKRGTSAAEMHSTLTGKGVAIIGSTRHEQVEVYLVAVDTSKNKSTPSEKVTITTLGVLDEPQVKQMFEDVLKDLEDMDAAHGETIAAIQTDVDQARSDAEAAHGLASEATTAAQGAHNTAMDAQGAADTAATAAEAAQSAADAAAREAAAAAGLATEAQTTASNAETAAGAAQAAANAAAADAIAKAAAAEKAAKDHADAVAEAERLAAIAAASDDATAKADAARAAAAATAAADAEAKANAALAAAKLDATEKADAAAAIAKSKADVLIQPTAPAAAMRKSTTLWIDTTGGANTPKRWDGGKWAEVTDKVAQDAANDAVAAKGAADAAQAAADAAQAAADNAQATADAAQTAAGNAQDTATNALTSANGRNSRVTSTADPSGTTNPNTGQPWVEGDTWWRWDNNTTRNVIKAWTYRDGKWELEKIRDEVLASLDVNKLVVTGSTYMDQAVVDKIIGNAGHFGLLTAERLAVAPPTNMLAGVERWSQPGANTDDKPWRHFGHSPGWSAMRAQGYLAAFVEQEMEFTAGTRYRFEVDVKASVPDTRFFWELQTADGGRITWGDRSGSANANPQPNYPFSAALVPGTEWNTYWAEGTALVSGVARLRMLANHSLGTSNPDGYQWFRNPRIRAMVGGVLIENGAVTADKVKADLSMANHFSGLMATFEEAFIGKVKADYVNSGSFSGKLFSGGTFTGSVFRTANTSGARVQMDSTGIKAYNSSNSLTFSLSGSSGSINGFTITGGTVRTSSSGARVEMTSSGTFQGLQRLDAQGRAVMRLGLDSSAVDQALTFWRTTTAGLRNGTYHALGFDADGLTFRNPSNGQEYAGLKGTLNNQLAMTSGRAHVMVKDNGLTTLGGSIIDFNHLHPDLVQQTWRLQAASAAGITASTWRFMPGRLKMTQTALAANLHIDANGYIHHTTSARKWKLDIRDVGVDPSLILNVRVRDWIDRSAASLDENYSTRTPGVVAEELEEAGLSEFVTYDELEDGTHISGVLYDRLALLLIPVVRDLRDRLDALEGNK